MSALASPITHEASAVRLPNSLAINPRLDRWLRFSSDGHVEVSSGKVEIGQGILTALAQIAAEELDVRIDQVHMIAATTTASPDEAMTSGSLSIQESGSALRQACAEARAIYLQAAAGLLDVDIAMLTIEDGNIVVDDRRTSYWVLANDRLLDRDANGSANPKSATDYRVIGAAIERVDLPDKIFGRPCFIHDLELPDMLHGRMLRPASPSALLVSIDDSEARAIDGVHAIVRDGSLIGVLAVSEAIANRAIEKLAAHATWQSSASLPDQHALTTWLKAQPVETSEVDRRPSTSREDRTVARTLRAAYAKPYLAHGSIGPSCALARYNSDRIDVWTHSQGIFNLRKDLALAFDIKPDAVAVHHIQGAGCYGHNGADDVAFDAAWLARAADGRPVRVLWSRADELSWAPFAPAMTVELEADLDADGTVLDWRHAIWSNGHGTRPGRGSTPALLGSWYLQEPFEQPLAVDAAASVGGGSERNAVPLYDFRMWAVIKHRVLSMPLRTSALRALGALANVFAIESFVDEIAASLEEDPIAFRLRHLSDARARAVIERVVANSSWRAWQAGEGRGHGIGFAKYKNTGAYCAVVAEIEAKAEIRVTRLVIAVDVGRVINPDGVANQIEGGAIQATSWTLKEAVRFDAERVTSTSWDDYPILRFSEVPKIEIEIIDSDQPSVGAGEPSLGPTVAAIANAVCDALGVRVRALPLTAERIAASE